MVHALPITNVRLSPCSVGPEQFTAIAGGHFCASCQRVVHDFTQATRAELEALRAAAPDGRLCGQFRLSQLAPDSRPARLRLRPRLRQFLLAAVLILVQELSARQAWAQAQQRPVAPFRPPATEPLYALPQPEQLQEPRPAPPTESVVFGGVEQMPVFPGGQDGLLRFLRANLHYPDTALAGKVFVRFTVSRTGQVTGPVVQKGVHPLLDAEALRVISLMPPWTPGTQNGLPVDTQYTVPITFRHDDTPLPRKRH
jgi:protein TonB